MTIDWWTLSLQTVNVAILIWILAHFLFEPVRRIISERQEAAHAALDAARAEQEAAARAHAAAENALAQVAEQRAALLAQAQTEAAAEKQRLMGEAQHSAEALRQSAQEDLKAMREAEARAMADDASQLAADITTRLLARLPDSARVDGFIDGLASALAGVPQASLAEIGLRGPVAIRAARALTEPETERLVQALESVLGRSVELAVTEDPDLIAGLALDAPTAIVSNHFRADLAAITESLSHHG